MKNELIIKILKKLDEESILLKAEELGLDQEQYGELLEIMMDGHLIMDVKVIRSGQGSKVQAVMNYNAKITTIGIEYLRRNR